MTAPPIRYVWKARVIAVVDADTIDVAIDVGFRSVRTERLRLLGVNAPEVRGPSREAGKAATLWVEDWLSRHMASHWGSIIVETHKSDSFGRYLGTVWSVSGPCLNEELIAAGHAVADVRP